jgi:hypothetical protein
MHTAPGTLLKSLRRYDIPKLTCTAGITMIFKPERMRKAKGHGAGGRGTDSGMLTTALPCPASFLVSLLAWSGESCDGRLEVAAWV